MRRIVLIIITLTLGFDVYAETAICTGKVDRIAYHEPDGLWLAVGGSKIFKACGLDSQFNRTSPENCKMIVGLATTAKVAGKDLSVYIDNAPSTSCDGITNWFLADVRFVELL